MVLNYLRIGKYFTFFTWKHNCHNDCFSILLPDIKQSDLICKYKQNTNIMQSKNLHKLNCNSPRSNTFLIHSHTLKLTFKQWATLSCDCRSAEFVWMNCSKVGRKHGNRINDLMSFQLIYSLLQTRLCMSGYLGEVVSICWSHSGSPWLYSWVLCRFPQST
jgi:hypothetical protein